MSRLEYYYNNVLRYELIVKYNYTNSYQIPKINAVHYHVTSKAAIEDNKNIFPPMLALEMISGQKAHLIKAKHSISSFKVRKGALIGCHVTLRDRYRTYAAMDYLVSSILPKEDRERLKIGWKSDDEGNVSFGISDCFAYKELEEEYDKFSKWIKGLQVTITMSSQISNKQPHPRFKIYIEHGGKNVSFQTVNSAFSSLAVTVINEKEKNKAWFLFNKLRDIEARKTLLQSLQFPIK